MSNLFSGTKGNFYLRGHCIGQTIERFNIKTPEQIVAFYKKALSKAKICIESKTRIAIISEQENAVFKAKKHDFGITLITIIPLQRYSNYFCRIEKWEKTPEENFSQNPLIFAGTNLYKKNIIIVREKK